MKAICIRCKRTGVMGSFPVPGMFLCALCSHRRTLTEYGIPDEDETEDYDDDEPAGWVDWSEAPSDHDRVLYLAARFPEPAA